MVSLWPVSDEDASLAAGRDVMREETVRPYEHPYYWAPFILIGRGE